MPISETNTKLRFSRHNTWKQGMSTELQSSNKNQNGAHLGTKIANNFHFPICFPQKKSEN